MTRRATFGDFATATSYHLDLAAGPPGPAARREQAAVPAGTVDEFARSLHRLLTVMSRHCDDITAALRRLPVRDQRKLAAWMRASSRTHEALSQATALLQPGPAAAAPPVPTQPDSQAGRLDAATASLTTARDLLHTHLTIRSGGARLDQSEWAPVITSVPVTRALLCELASWARLPAPAGARLAVAGAQARGTGEERRKLNAACQWLWVLSWAVEAAHERDPVPACDVRLLHAIPVNALARRHVRRATSSASWSPSMTRESLRQTAAYSTVISHNCHLLLRALADRATYYGSVRVSARLLESSGAAGNARQAWLQTAGAWHQITTDTRRAIAPAAAETADLALWTGRLAYADPSWTPALGPSHATRPPQNLAPEPGDIPGVVAAVHHACETLSQLAAADHSQIVTAGRAGRLLVPTRSIPDTFDIPYPFGPATGAHLEPLLSAYHDAEAASLQATTEVATVATAVRAPSQILTTARAVVQASRDGVPAGQRQHRAEPPAPRRSSPEMPGPVERILSDLGVTAPATLQRAAAVDQAGEQLILEAAQTPGTRPLSPASRDLSRSAGSAEVINHLLASGDPRTAAIWDLPQAMRTSQAEIEP